VVDTGLCVPCLLHLATYPHHHHTLVVVVQRLGPIQLVAIPDMLGLDHRLVFARFDEVCFQPAKDGGRPGRGADMLQSPRHETQHGYAARTHNGQSDNESSELAGVMFGETAPLPSREHRSTVEVRELQVT